MMVPVSPETRPRTLGEKTVSYASFESRRNSAEHKKDKNFDLNSESLEQLDEAFLQDVLIMRSDKRNGRNVLDAALHRSPSPDPRYQLATRSFPPSASSVVTDCSEGQIPVAHKMNICIRNASRTETDARNQTLLPPMEQAFTLETLQDKTWRSTNSKYTASVSSRSSQTTGGSQATSASSAIPRKFSFSSSRTQSGKSASVIQPAETVTRQVPDRRQPQCLHRAPCSKGPPPTNVMDHSQSYTAGDQPQYPGYSNHGPYGGAYQNPPHHPGLSVNQANGHGTNTSGPFPGGMVPHTYCTMPPSNQGNYQHLNQGPYSKLMQNKKEGAPLMAGPTTNQGPYSVLVKNTHYTPKLQLPAWIGPNDVLQGDSEMGLSVFSNYSGNKLYRERVRHLLGYYTRAQTSEERKTVASWIFSWVTDAGGRFLRTDSSGEWDQLSESQAIKKIMNYYQLLLSKYRAQYDSSAPVIHNRR